MPTASEAYQNSLLAQAAYADLPADFSTKSEEQKKNALIVSLKNQGMSSEAAV